jgi:hypothetical protein
MAGLMEVVATKCFYNSSINSNNNKANIHTIMVILSSNSINIINNNNKCSVLEVDQN